MTDRGHISLSSLGESSITSTRLLEGLKARDGNCWKVMASLYAPLVHRWAARAGLRPDDAADVVQEVFTVVVRRIASFRRDQPGDSFRGWLWGITQNMLRNRGRRLAGQAKAAGGSAMLEMLHHVAAEPSSSSADGLGTLCHRALALIRSEFEFTTWQAFWLVAVEGRSSADVARELNMTVNAVYLAKSRVTRRLREMLEAEDLD